MKKKREKVENKLTTYLRFQLLTKKDKKVTLIIFNFIIKCTLGVKVLIKGVKNLTLYSFFNHKIFDYLTSFNLQSHGKDRINFKNLSLKI